MRYLNLILFFLPILSICCMGLTILGSKKGTIMLVAIMILIAFGYVLSVFNIGVENILLFDKRLLMLIGTATAFVLLFVSYYISLWVYTKRYS